jgi:FkbM family methyltransferase
VLLNNLKTVLTRPSIGVEFVEYNLSKLRNGGRAVRTITPGIKVTGLSGFGEYHFCKNFVNDQERRFFSQLPQVDGVILDVGANLGVVSVILSRRFADRVVYAFEPNPTTYAALQENLALNRCANVQAQPMAIADRDGSIMFAAHPKDRGTTSIATADSANTISVKCSTIDTFLTRIAKAESVSFMKVDVEGFEALVFAGAEDALTHRRIATVYFEVFPKLAIMRGFDADAAARILLRHGYDLKRVGEDGRLREADVADLPNVVVENWVALRR